MDEAALGDPLLAAERLRALSDIPLIDLPKEVSDLAAEILARAILPMAARVDALHIAAASFHGIDYLLTWNCKHIANAQVLRKLREVLLELDYWVPILCTPQEMIGGDDEA